MTIKLTRLDLGYILTQIEMAEAGQAPVNPQLAFGLREIDGTNNNLSAQGAKFGAAFQTFPTVSDPLLQNAQGGTSYAQTNGLVIDAAPRTISLLVASQNANSQMTAAQKIIAAGADGILGNADDVFVNGNAAAFAAQQRALGFLGDGYKNFTLPGPDGIYGTVDDTGTTFTWADGTVHTTFGNLATPTNASNSSSTIGGLAQSLFIPNVTPDNGLSAPYNSFFTIFGQFFDHGLDLIDKNGPVNGFVFIPLATTDPLYAAASAAGDPFMVLDRAQMLPGPDGVLGTSDDVHQFTNTITPFIDQSQTYGSDSSHDAFLREYMIGADGKLHSTGKLLSGKPELPDATGVVHTTLATWADLKASAAKFLGIKITDLDVNAIPLLATDNYGNLIFGANGLAQLVVKFADGTQGLLAGNLTTPTATSGFASKVPGGPLVHYNALTSGAAFINDKAVTADPVNPMTGAFLPADSDTTLGNAQPVDPQTGMNTTYDNELLDQHKVAGDGRLNENLGLTAIQQIFHSEHDRLVAQIESLVQTNLNNGDVSFASDWVLPGVNLQPTLVNGVSTPHVIQANEWNGDRVFQAAKFGTETEYQHIVFEEFARMVAPTIHPAGATNVHLDPAITSEFANVVYRFGHSMLDENLNIYQLGADGKAVIDPATGQPVMTAEGLIDAFTNPLKFASDPNMTADLVMGMTNQVGNEIDEFVTGTLQNNLDGAPLDLASLNIARGRDTGVAPLNLVRNQLFTESGETQLKAYTSWVDFGSELKHIESLANFIAAYGTYSTITAATTNAGKVAAAQALIAAGTLHSTTFNLDAYSFMTSTGVYANNKLNALAVHDTAGVPATWSTGSITGVDNIDMWIGGLAEKQSLFGGVLGSTFEYVFRTQMEALQDADRLYYLPRIEGTDYEESLQDSSLAQLIKANTDIAHPAGNIFQTPEYNIEASTYYAKDLAGNFILDANGNPTYAKNADGTLNTTNWLKNPTTGALEVNVNPDGTLVFVGDNNFLGNDVVMGGTAANDKMTAGPSDGDTLWGDGGNDTLDGGGGADFLFGGDGNDTLQGGQGADQMHGDTGNDTMYGGDDLDTMFGGDGNDYMEGGRGDDSMFGGLGNDIIIGNEGFNTLIGGEGDDWLESRGGQGNIYFGDSGAPTGQQPLYSGNDVMVGGAAGGDIMKGFSGDDIMLGHGAFTKFIGGLGFDWGSYELATQAVDEDMNRKEFVAANGAVDNTRDVWTHTEGASGSAFNDIILGDNATRQLVTKDELDNVNLITGLQGFFDPGVVSFDGGNIILGGGGSDTLIGGGGNDIIDGDAWLHVGLTSYSAGGQIIRQILYDANGNTYDPSTAKFTLGANGLVVPGTFVAGTGHVNATNVDTAVYNDVLSNYNVALFGPDAEGFLTIQHNGVAVVVGANPQGVLGVDDGTDRIRNIERLQFSDGEVAIDKNGNMISSSFNPIADPNYATLYAPYYDAVPFGVPTITETDPVGNTVDPTVTVAVGNTLHASVATISDFDGITTPFNYQWQYVDATSGNWVDYAGATAADFTVPLFLLTQGLGVRVKISYVDGKSYTEQLHSLSTVAAITLPGGALNTPPTLIVGTQFNGIADTTALAGQSFDYFSPFAALAVGGAGIFTDQQQAANTLIYKAVLTDGSALSNANLSFSFNPVTGAGEFKTIMLPGPDTVLGTADDVQATFDTPGQIGIRVTATDNGGLTLTNTFVITVVPPNSPPNAINDSYTTLENVGLTAIPSTGVLHNDSDPNADPFTAAIVAGPTHGALTFHADGTFVYIPTKNFVGTDFFTYQDTDSAGAVSNIATATINVVDVGKITVAPTAPATTNSVTETFTVGALAPAGAVALSWDTSLDGVAWTPTGVASAVFLPAVTGPTGTFLRGTANFQNAGSTVSVTSDPVYYISDNDLGDNMTGISGNNIIFGNGGDDLIAAGIGSLLAYGGLGNDTFVATVGDGVATFDGQAGVNTLDMSHTLAGATVNLVTHTASSSDTAAATLVSIQNVIGSKGDDHIVGDANNNTFFATVADGNDSYTGGGGIDTYDLSLTAAGATVNLGLGKATSLDIGSDALAGISNVVGGAGNDTFVAAVGDGTHSYNGGLGIDTYDLSASATAASVNLATGTASFVGEVGGSDTLVLNTIENVIGGAGNDTITGDANDNVLTGGLGNDTMVGGGGNDTFIGGLGADSMTGAAGNDTYFVDNVGDVVVELASQGTDIINTTLNIYSIAPLANVENLTFIGVGDFTGTGNGLANIITGGAGNDTLNGVTGADTMIGGAGNDTYFVDNTGDVVTEKVGNGTDTIKASANYTLAGGSEVESLIVNTSIGLTLTGNEFSHTITGNTGNDTLIGGIGNDTLNGSTGADTMAGGAGNDTYFVDNAGDVVTENVGNGTDTIKATANYTLAGGSEVESLTVNTSIGLTLTGNEFSHTITGNTGNDTLNGGVGNDTLNGSTGADTMAGGAGNDTYFVDNTGDVVTEAVGQGTDTVMSNVSYTLAANLEVLTANGGTNLTLTGNALANTINGTAGNDTLDGKAGADAMNGGAGNDTYFVDNAGDTVADSTGTDTVNTTLLNYTLGATIENLSFIGSGNFTGTGTALNNVITGGAGSDTLSTGAGNDTLIGGAGADKMTGGAGNDAFQFFAGFGADNITDFTAHAGLAANKDLIDVSGLGITAATFATSVALSGGSNALITILGGGAAGGTILLSGVNQSAINAADFKFAP
jgi:Ca2+-binding RTX toxin-like protein